MPYCIRCHLGDAECQQWPYVRAEMLVFVQRRKMIYRRRDPVRYWPVLLFLFDFPLFSERHVHVRYMLSPVRLSSVCL